MNPFDLNNEHAYQQWREAKLENYPTELEQLVVEIKDLKNLSSGEHEAVMQRVRKTGMALYASPYGATEDKTLIVELGRQLGLERLDNNMCADEDAVSSLQIASDDLHAGYIPYSNRPIDWHTDGYYNTGDHQICGLLLHCVRPAKEGGMNDLLDHEIAYIMLRDRDPTYIEALMHPEAMTIPANIVDGETLRANMSGPVFSIAPQGFLHMRYTARKRNIIWRDNPATHAAVAALAQLLADDTPWHFHGTLQSGMGLISNNVLHTRSGFEANSERLLYRARYFDRIRGS